MAMSNLIITVCPKCFYWMAKDDNDNNPLCYTCRRETAGQSA